MRRVRAYLRDSTGKPLPFMAVLGDAMDLIQEASAAGKGVRLTAEHARALDWANIRADGGHSSENWRESAFSGAQEG